MLSLTMLSSRIGISSRNPPSITTSAEGSIRIGALISAPDRKKLRNAPCCTRLSATGTIVKLTPSDRLSARLNASRRVVSSTTATVPWLESDTSFPKARPRSSPNTGVATGRTLSHVSLQIGCGSPVLPCITALPCPSRLIPQNVLPSGQPPNSSHSVTLAAHRPFFPAHSTRPAPHPSHWIPMLAHSSSSSAHVDASAQDFLPAGQRSLLPLSHCNSRCLHFQSAQRNGLFAGHGWLTTVHGMLLAMQPSTAQSCWLSEHPLSRLSLMMLKSVALSPKQSRTRSWQVPRNAEGTSSSSGHRTGMSSSHFSFLFSK
mmetsp:Transcript_11122/g.17557  ORF Transcript_11122/g.17557 Transcript_11122/m.17557 type:complete len:316 (-) Transcript_11122:634-1581(-)